MVIQGRWYYDNVFLILFYMILFYISCLKYVVSFFELLLLQRFYVVYFYRIICFIEFLNNNCDFIVFFYRLVYQYYNRFFYFLLSSRLSGEGVKRKGFFNIQGFIQIFLEFLVVCDGKFDVVLAMLGEDMIRNQLDQFYQVMGIFFQVEVNMEVKGWWEGGEG